MSNEIYLTTSRIHPFTPQTLENRDPKPVFQIRIPAFAERDQISTILFANGFVPVAVEHGRALLIEAIYETQVGDTPEEREAAAEETVLWLEGYWQRAEAYNRAIEQWNEQETVRLADIDLGAPFRPQAPKPERTFTPRESARATRLGVEMLDRWQPYRELQARHASQSIIQEVLTTRLFIAGWTGLETKFESDGQKMTEACTEALRGEIGVLAWDALVREVHTMFFVNGTTRGNSESPLEQSSNQDGSPNASGASGQTNGSSTGSNTEPTPSGG